MVSVELLEQEKPVVAEEWTPLVSQQVSEILEEGHEGPDLEETEQKSWYYRVPFAGVRYYSY